MKTYLVIGLFLSAFAAGTGGIVTPPQSEPSAKECTDCGCSGAGSDGMCPKEKEKTCKCEKK